MTELQPKMWAASHVPTVLGHGWLVATPRRRGVLTVQRAGAGFFFCHSMTGEIITGCNQSVLYDDQQSDQSA